MEEVDLVHSPHPAETQAVLGRDRDREHTLGTVSDKITRITLRWPITRNFVFGLVVAFLGTMMLLTALTYLVLRGTGIWGINIPVAWGFAIINFVWWIGIGHAGTLISAILLLLKQDWRTSINRFAEAMTIFAVACAGMFPVFHMGRCWIFYWLLPYPNTMQLWPQPRSPLVWDVFAVSTYATVSLLFWYTGMVPDFATLRDRAQKMWIKRAYGLLSFGWRGSARHWLRFETASLLLAGLSTPLVVSVHTVVSWDFAAAQLPGWHTTIFPPYFVAGAIYSGFAMVLTLIIPVRVVYRLEDMVTQRHLQCMAKFLLATGWIVAYGYIMEIVMAFYSGNPYEIYLVKNRMTGPYWPLYWSLWATNIISPQCLWLNSVRSKQWALWIVSLIINIGMWLERFVIVVTSLHRDFLPSSWGIYTPTIWDWATYLGTLGFFTLCMFMFIRGLPIIAIFEMRGLVKPKEPSPTSEPQRSPVNV